MGCNGCSCQCGNERQKIEQMAAQYKNAVAVMNQATYEAITGYTMQIAGIAVEINNNLLDRQYLVTGETNGTR